MSDPFNYCPDQVNVLVAGFIPLTGFVDGTFISITKDIMPFTPKRTPDGSIARVHHNDQTYTIVITLHNGSESNDLLTKVWQLDEITRTAKFPLIIKDHSGSDLFFSATSWIESPAQIIKSSKVDERIWTIRSAQAFTNIGSNTDPSSLLEDIFNIATAAIPALERLI